MADGAMNTGDDSMRIVLTPIFLFLPRQVFYFSQQVGDECFDRPFRGVS